MPRFTAQGEQKNFLVHPGDQLLQELNARNLTQKDIAYAIDKPTPLINEIINHKRRFSAETSALLGVALGMAQDYWINLQSQYELACITEEKSYNEKVEFIQAWNRLKEIINISALKKRFNLEDDTPQCVKTIFDYFGVTNVEEFEQKAARVSSGYFRKSGKRTMDPKDLLTWTMVVKRESEEKEIEGRKFNKNCETQLLRELNGIFLKNISTVEQTASVLEKYGIRFILEKKIDQMPVDGYSFWIGTNPTIAMTGRFNRIDNFAFTLMHEIGHLMKHLSPKDGCSDSLDFYMSDANEYEARENEADEYAVQSLMGKTPIEELFSRCRNLYASEKEVESFAKENNINKSIVAGQIRHHYKAYSVLSGLIAPIG